MVFSSIVFLSFFLPSFLSIYFLSQDRYKNSILLAFSLFFYAWGAPKFIFLVLPLTAIDFWIVNEMYHEHRPKQRKQWLLASLAINLGILAVFKYANFFVHNINDFLGILGLKPLKWIEIALPIGISFFCFETLTYSIDAYRGIIKPLKSLRDYYLYIFLFPKLIAGPIVRFNLIDKEIRGQRISNDEDKIGGMIRFSFGLAKKVMIANPMGQVADSVFSGNFTEISSYSAWIGILAYTFQIYFDFSGYSDMTLGLGRIMGFHFPENFNNPYTSTSITEFWKKWHITLGAWMREYVYFPLGGNRVSVNRMYLNLTITFLISGFWHGASWNFVIWGAYHGIFLILDRIFFLSFSQKMGKIPSVLVTFFLVMMGWVLFRIEEFPKAMEFYQTLFSFQNGVNVTISGEAKFTFLLAIFFSFFVLFPKAQAFQEKVYQAKFQKTEFTLWSLIAIILLIISYASLLTSDFNPFIYFRF